jgi:phosphoenolpyruvate carboxykinase (GTP)
MSLDGLRMMLDEVSRARLQALGNPALEAFVAESAGLCEPAAVRVITDSPEDRAYTRRMALSLGEERPLAVSGHTVHFDGIEDQGRDREVTKYLVAPGETLGPNLNQMPRDEGLAEVRALLKGAMRGRIMIVRLMTLGPAQSRFSIPCVECTDSFYVSHSLDLLYRPGYEEFKRIGPSVPFFATLHSCGRMDERMVSAEPDKKRIYIDCSTDTVYSVNTQYAGNTVGLKKLALRLAVRKADRERWLAEHMFLMAVRGPGGRKTYFAGAFPSACGKTSTAMLPGESILGDDLAYFRIVDGRAMAVNAEAGVFGIIQGVNPHDDPAIWAALTQPGEVIFSNVLVKDGRPYWLGMGEEPPTGGENFAGDWHKGMKDPKGNDIPCAHKNARYAVSLKALANCDPEVDNPAGVELAGIMYGGRDADAYVPCQQGFSWTHGIIAYGASLETETTFAIVGAEGQREINVMSIQDFVAISLGKYVQNNLDFGARLPKPPIVFGVNYFLRDQAGRFVTGMRDKAVWVKWMERRVHGEMQAVRTPTGWIPRLDDLRLLFKAVLDKLYTEADYVRHFTIRVRENLAKLDRVERFYRERVPDAPPVLHETLAEQRRRLLDAQARLGDYVSPLDLA